MSASQTRFTMVEKVLAVVGLLAFTSYCYMNGIFFHYIKSPEQISAESIALEIKGTTVFVTTEEYIQQALFFWVFIACAAILTLIRLIRFCQKRE